MNKHRYALVVGTLAWVAISFAWGAWFCMKNTKHPGSEGYEAEWTFQALMFVYSHGVALVLIGAMLLGVLHELFRDRN
jgi:hypothetical protein